MKSEIEYKDVLCKHCDLHFSTNVWLKKHITKCHPNVLHNAVQATATTTTPTTSSDPTTKILNYKKQLEVIQNSLAKKNDKGKKKSKSSPSKQKLHEQLKAQLAAQQKLLQFQQEIFEKTTKAQQNIFELIAKLGDDESDDPETDEEPIVQDEVKLEDPSLHTGFETETEIYLEDPEGELITGDHDAQYIELPEQYEEHLVTEEDEFVLMNEQIAAETEAMPEDQSLMVIVRSEDGGEEEYELIDVVEDPLCSTSQIERIDGKIGFEVTATDSNSVHCRIVSNEEEPEQLEYVDVQVEPNEKLPLMVDVGKIQQISKRINKQLESKKKTKEADSKLLNTTVNKSVKNTNEYIQKVVQDAVATDDNKFECPICHEMVSNRYSLGPHILRLHSKQKSKICQYCDRSFTCTGDLTR